MNHFSFTTQILQLVGVRGTVCAPAKLGTPRTTFYRSPTSKHVWNRIPGEVRRKVVKLALKETELSSRELAVTFTDKESYFVSEVSTYRILKAHERELTQLSVQIEKVFEAITAGIFVSVAKGTSFNG